MMNSEIYDTLKHYFGFDGFLDHQQQIVSAVLAGRDLCVIMPTGAGKSLCYQLPLLLKPGYGIIVSPLISLMKDQVDSLQTRGIPAAFINSTVEFREQRDITARAASGEIKLLYVAPERFQTDFFSAFLANHPPQTLIVDEAHCISQWGHDFRPAYRRIGEVADRFHIPQVCAFTATATPRVREDICLQLHRPEMELKVAGFKRPNLAFSVLNCTTDASKLDLLRRLLEKRVPTIIYTSTRKAVEQLTGEFDGVIGYHAGMSDSERTLAQERFMNDPCPVLAATNAFGMGIDRPDVRQVIHYNLPGSLEAYYQEAGRAGRDGEAAECILLFSFRDRFIQEFLIDQANPPPEVVGELYLRLLELGRERNSVTLEMTFGELLPEVAGAKSENQLSAAMALLERNGYVDRSYQRNSGGTMRFTEELQKLRIQHQLENTQRSRFISRCIRQYGETLLNAKHYTVEELAAAAGLNEAQIRRVLSALNGDVLEWESAFSGRTTQLLRPEEYKLEIDFDELEKKRALELDRLEEVLSYARGGECRQRLLVSYFGENAEEWNCGCCDNCSAEGSRFGKRKLDAAELDAVRTILQTVSDFSGRLGAGKIGQILAGKKNADLTARRLHLNPHFGELRAWRQNRISAYLRALEAEGFIGRIERGDFPCVELTARGLEVCNGHAEPELALPEYKEKPVRQRSSRAGTAANFAPEFSSLYDALCDLRKQLAEARGVRLYMIFGNETLAQLAERKPLTVAEALQIPGIGPAKAATVLPLFLETIRKYLKAEADAR